MTGYKAGDRVVVNGTGRFRHERYDGKVTRTTARYAWAEFDDASGREEISFDMESGLQRGGNEFRVRTPEQVDLDDRKAAAIFVLENVGIELKGKQFFTTEQAEALAEVVKDWEGDR